jgi:hypothetical protein
MAVILAVVGAILISCGFALWNIPVGIVTAGAECLVAAYVTTYLRARAVR